VTNWPGGGREFGGSNPIGPDNSPPPSGSGGWQPPAGGGAWPPPPQAPGSWQQPPPPTQPGPPPAPGPWQGPPPPGWPPVGPPPGQGGWPPGPPPRGRSRRPLIITIVAGVAVLVVVGIVLAITLTGSGGGPGAGSAGDTVKGYLEALAKGDAETALSYSDDQPASKEFLTDDILKQQIAKWPITNIRILNDDGSASSIGMAQVHVVANFGDKTSDATLQLKRTNNRWRLDSAALKLQPSPGIGSEAAAATMTFFGKPVEGTTYVFPGWIDVGSSNPYVEVKAQPMLLDTLTSYTPWVQADFSINDAGNKAVMDALADVYASCQKSNQLAPPPPCPEAIRNSDGSLVDGTISWGVADLSQIKLQSFDPYHLTMMFFGKITIPLGARDTSGGQTTGTLDPFVTGTADLAKTPPTIDFQN